MTARSIRRAAERKAAKRARKAEHNQTYGTHLAGQTTPDEQLDWAHTHDEPAHAAEPPSRMLSSAQLTANRANAQLSTGPATPEGKAKASRNAVKTALTGRTVLLPTDDADEYERHLRSYEKDLQPLGARELALVQSLADTDWRLHRIPLLEMALFAEGHSQFAEHFADRDPAERPALIELHTFLTYEKQIRNLQLQEGRLHGRREKDAAELRKVQQERNARERRDLDVAAKLYIAAKHDGKPFDPADHGFEFSIHDVHAYLEGVRAANIASATLTKDRDAALDRFKTQSRAA